jgi:hypothetical protein
MREGRLARAFAGVSGTPLSDHDVEEFLALLCQRFVEVMEVSAAGAVPVQDATTPADETPAEVSRPQRLLQTLQWAIPALTGAVLVVNARMGEQQRPAQVAGGLLGRLRRRRAA